MAFDWSAYFTIAEELATRNDEAAKRTAISRAYYAVYGTACDRYVAEAGPVPLGINAHAAIWNWYTGSNVRARWFIGREGKRLLGFRASADYAADYRDVMPDTERAIVIARKTLDNLAKL